MILERFKSMSELSLSGAKGETILGAFSLTARSPIAEGTISFSKFQDETGILVRDYSIYADTDSKPGRYVLFIEPDKEIDEAKIGEYRDIAEKLLGQANPSFGQKIMSSTLGKTKLCITQQEAYMLYRDIMIRKGVSQNQLKPVRAIDTPMKEKFFFKFIEMETE